MNILLYTFREPYPIIAKHGGDVRIVAVKCDRINRDGSSDHRLFLHAVLLVNEMWYAVVNQPPTMAVSQEAIVSVTPCAMPGPLPPL